MCLKNLQDLELKELLFFSFLALIGVLGLTAWMQALIIPDWEVYVKDPFFASLHGYILLGIILLLIVFIVYFIVSLAIDKELLERENKNLSTTITQLERELQELRRRG